MRKTRILEDRYSYISLIPARLFDLTFLGNLTDAYEVKGSLKGMPENYYLPGDVEIRGDDWRVVVSEKVMQEFEIQQGWEGAANKAGFFRAEGHDYKTPSIHSHENKTDGIAHPCNN